MMAYYFFSLTGPEVYNNLGNTLKELGRFDEAEPILRKAIALEPDFLEANSNLGHLLAETGRLDEAAESYKRALSCDPNYMSAEIRLVHVPRQMFLKERHLVGKNNTL